MRRITNDRIDAMPLKRERALPCSAAGGLKTHEPCRATRQNGPSETFFVIKEREDSGEAK